MRFIWISVGWLLIFTILYLSLFTAHIPKQSISNVDKLHHFIAYGALMIWFAQGFRGNPRLIIAGFIVAMGIAVEFLQPLTGREFSILDMLANTGGVLVGLFVTSKGGDFLFPKLQKPE